MVATSQQMNVIEIPLDTITPNPDQPRKLFDQSALEGLATSIFEVGLLQPILVKRDPAAEGRYIIAAGERRWRAHKLIGKATIRAICMSGDIDEIAVVENAQRVDLHAVERAMAIRRLSVERQCSDESLAQMTGLSRAEITKLVAVGMLPTEMLSRFLTMSPEPSKSALFEVAMAPGEIQPALADLVAKGASIASLRRARVRLEQSEDPVTAGALGQNAQDVPALGRRLKRLTTTLGTVRSEGRPLSDQDRGHLRALRASIDAVLNDDG
ncbi:Stage 0 sporulation protein J [Caenispirillum salinarum AK4]|uniref:Stage 0 sporulation protein J n=2 Tax=Caenispirillum TaxID=414051 RepID=K9HCW8_9PROT|nr:Stage 0 sporulation protein J [Caenispirillum salinarum AK4]